MATLAPLAPARAQVSGNAGGVRGNVAYSYLYWHAGDGQNRVNHLRAVVLWALKEDTRQSSRDSALVWRRRSMDAQLRADSLGRHYFGGTGTGGDFHGSYSNDSLYVLERAFPLPRGDSALVLLVAHTDSLSGAAIVGLAHVSAVAPASIWGATWQSGDTTFSIHGRPDDLFAHLRSVPDVRRFLDSHVRSN